MFKSLSFLVLGLFLQSRPAAAGFLLFEPSVGYVQGHYDLLAASGIAADFRLGFRLGSEFYLGADVMYGMPSLAATAPASGSGYAATLMDMGAVLGWDMGKFRIGFSYIFSSKLSWSDAGGNPTSNTGNGYKLGLGFDLSDKMILGLDAIFDSYNTQSAGGSSSKTPNFMDLAYISLAWKVW